MDQDSRVRARTRRAILDAAVSELSRDRGASLGQIADVAGVARSTLHRYFPERSDLMSALGGYAGERLSAATVDARLEEGTGLEALVRLCRAYFDLGDILMLTDFGQSAECLDAGEFDEASEDIDGAIERTVTRGAEDGTVDPELPALWINYFLWSTLYSAWEYSKVDGASRHEALEWGLRSVRKALAP